MKLQHFSMLAAIVAPVTYAWNARCRDEPKIGVGCQDTSDTNGILRCELKDGLISATFVQVRSGTTQTTIPLVSSDGEKSFFNLGRGVEGEKRQLVVGELVNGCEKEWLADYAFQGNFWVLASKPVGKKIGQSAPPAPPSNTTPASFSALGKTGSINAADFEAPEVERPEAPEIETPEIEAPEREDEREDERESEDDD